MEVVPVSNSQGGYPLPPESPPPPKLPMPPGVYFSLTERESVDFVDRWIAGQEMPEMGWSIFKDDVYRASPDVLRREYPPGRSRAGKHSWWFLGLSWFQCADGGRSGRTKRSTRLVATGGFWQIEQKKKELPGIGAKNNFGYYTNNNNKDKSAWLMEEFTSARHDGTGKLGVPALYRIYVSPSATNDKIRAIYGDDAVPELPSGAKKTVRVTVPAEYFSKVAERLPPGSVRGPGPQHNAPPPPPQSLTPQQQFMETTPPSHVLYHHEQFLEAAPPLPPPPLPPCANDDNFQEQFFQTAPPLPPCALDGDFQGQFFQAAPPLLLGDVEEFQGQYYMEADTTLPPQGDLDGSQGQCHMESAMSVPPPPPAPAMESSATSLPPPPPPLPPASDLDIDFDLDDMNMWDFSMPSIGQLLDRRMMIHHIPAAPLRTRD